MNRLVVVFASTAVAVATSSIGSAVASTAAHGGAVTVGPHTTTTVRSVYDCDARGLGGDCDMTGAVIGSVSYSQQADGSLQLTEHVNFARPNWAYKMLFTEGPSHDLALGFRTVGTLHTDANGRGSASVTLPVSMLQSSPEGAGYHTDHLDLLTRPFDLAAGVLVTGALNFYVPAGASSASATWTQGDPG